MRANGRIPTCLTIAALLLAASPIRGQDWPRFRGPAGTGIGQDVGLLRSWPEEGPKVLWRRPLGEGFSAISVVGERLYTLFADADDELAACFNAADGSEVWRRRIGEKFVDHWGDGPRATPAVDGDAVYALSANGELSALDTSTGEVLWQLDFATAFGRADRPVSMLEALFPAEAPASPFWGHCSSPLVEGDLLIVETGAGGGKSLAALDKHSGEVAWTLFDHPFSYSTPVAVTLHGQRQIVVTMTGEIAAVTPAGEVLWRHPWAIYNIAQPVFIPPDKIFVSAPYDVGALLLAVRPGGDAFRVEEVWRQPLMRNHWQSSVAFRGSIVGFDNATLKSWSAGGRLEWARRGLGKGSLVVADGLMFLLSDRGVLTLAEWSAEGFRETGRVEIFAGPSWTAPTPARGKLFLRNQREMVCVDLRG